MFHSIKSIWWFFIKNHPLSKLVIKQIQKSNFHCGRKQTLTILRNRYWTPNVRGLIRKVITDCLHCRKVSATSNPPFMADIPKERLQHNYKPFTNTGTDYFGPFRIKLSRAMRSNASKEKRYGVIFTFMTTSAVHLEISNDLSTDSFISSLKRFIAQQSQFKCLMSDNGTNFIGAER